MEFSLFAYITVVENFELLYINMGFPDRSAGKESTCNAGDLHLLPGLGRSLEEGKGYPLQYSGLENPVDRGACPWVAYKESDMTEAT